MKYIEEIDTGSSFAYQNSIFVLTSDFKQNGQRKAIDLSNGLSRWFDGDIMCEVTDLFILDKNNNLIKVKISNETNTQNQNIF